MFRSSVFTKVLSIIAAISSIVLYCSLVAGQLIRIPVFSQSGGLLLSDIAIGLVVVTVVLLIATRQIRTRAVYSASFFYAILFLPFFLFSAVMLTAQSQHLAAREFAVSALYWVRLFAISLLFVGCWILVHGYHAKKMFLRGFVGSYVALIAVGYIQLLIFPSLVGNINGWDPHIHRMVATWFDPNFFGGYIALCIFPVFYWSKGNIPLLIAGAGALVMTQSRSAWIACAIAALVVGVVWIARASLPSSWKKGAAVVVGVVLCGLLGIMGTAADRVTQLASHDPTAALRLASYGIVWHRLVEPYGIAGVGYNAYQFYAKKAHIIQDYSSHSRAGADSSILTLLVTTGIIGTALFFIPFLAGVYWHSTKWIRGASSEHLLFIWAFAILLVHSQFENSLLYAHLLMTMGVIASIIAI